MKPLKLTMTAFGPYKTTETIDFQELQGNRLFVISGATGAGKTTIFDGICFALYGYGSGEDRRDTKMMRSHFATDDTHTSVELTFEVHSKTYRVLRQLAHIKKGNKGATGERYEFFEVKDSREEPVVDRQIVSEINKKIEEIIGLTQEQFSQIVMLPQGEFRKLLTSQTENKEAILRKIFKTEPYKMISEKLKDKKLMAETELKKEEMSRNSFTEQISTAFPNRESAIFDLLASGNFNMFQLVEALKEETLYYKGKIQKDEVAYKEAQSKHEEKQVRYYEAKALNERFIQLEAKEQRLQSLKNQAEAFIEKQEKLEAAKRANNIGAVEQFYNELVQEATAKIALLETAQLKVKEAEAIKQQVDVLYLIEANKKEERDKSVEALIQLNNLLPLFEELEIKRKDMLDLEKDVFRLKEQVETTTQLFTKEKALGVSLQNEIAKIEALLEPLDDKVQLLSSVQGKQSIMQEFLMNEQILQRLESEEVHQEKVSKAIKHTYKVEEEKLMRNQASLLAAKLVAGEACPVCGSTKHEVTTVEIEANVMTQNELQQLKSQVNEQESRFLKIRAKKEMALETQTKWMLKLEEFHLTLLDADQLKRDLEALESEVNHLRKEKEKLAKLKEPYNSVLQKVEALEEQKSLSEIAFQKQNNLFEQAQAVYDSKKTLIPSHIPTLVELNKQINLAAKYKRELEQAWEEVQEQYKQATENLSKSQISLEHAITAAKESKEKKEKAFGQLQEALFNAGFKTLELYTTAKLPESDQEMLQEQINAYKQAVHSITDQVKEEQAQLEGKVKVELAPLEEEIAELKRAYEHTLNVLSSSKEYEKVGIELESKIATTSARITELEQRVSQIIDLYDTLRGQNHVKISFERYVQMEYLEQIIQAANERLKHLSAGQYYLKRSERLETHGRQSGLGLDVYDSYTGQTRDVKTLSGGEKFNASLCLALGMADVIQSFQGSIRIDTMFIDEGFGSLDEESLNKAIDTLVDLQKSGRMIGVISHVAELKSAIPAILEVEKLKEGYSRTKFVIK